MTYENKKKPVFKLKVNIPSNITFQNCQVDARDGEYGQFWTYHIVVEGIEHVFFATPAIQNVLEPKLNQDNQTLIVEKIEDGKYTKYIVTDINDASGSKKFNAQLDQHTNEVKADKVDAREDRKQEHITKVALAKSCIEAKESTELADKWFIWINKPRTVAEELGLPEIQVNDDIKDTDIPF